MQKGVVNVGDSVTAKIDADTDNSGVSTVQVGFSDYSGNTGPVGDGTAAPAGSCTTDPAVVASAPGFVAVLVTTPGGGTLTTFVNGEQRDSEHIEGATKWDYTVV